MGLCLNVGSGNRTYDYYPDTSCKCINFDIRTDLSKVDEIGDVTNLCRYPDNHFQYILASDILEHFSFLKTENILREWCRVLSIGGTIEFRVPNLTVICNEYIRTGDARHISWLLYGGQDYHYNFHHLCFDRAWLKSLTESVGLLEYSYHEEGNNFIMRCRKL